MTSITTLLKNNLMLNCYLLTQTVLLMTKANVYEEFFKHKHLFGFSNYPKDSQFFDLANKKVIVKMKDESEIKTIGAFVGLKSKMHSMKNIDKESNVAKLVNIATEFNEFKDTFNKKIIRHKREEFKAKSIKWEHTKSTKYHYHVLMINDLF